MNITSYTSFYRAGSNLKKSDVNHQQPMLQHKQYKPQLNSINTMPSWPSFSGLTGHIKKYAYETPKQIAAFAKAYPKSNGIAGNLPSSWIKKLPKEQKGEHIKQIYHAFSEVIKELQKPNESIQKELDKIVQDCENIRLLYLPYLEQSELLRKYMTIVKKKPEPYTDFNKLEDILNPVLKKAGITETSVKIKYEGFGHLGEVYKLTVDNEDYALKIHKKHKTEAFNNKMKILLDEEDIMIEEMNINGRYIEPNRSFFLQDIIGRNRKLLGITDNYCQYTQMYFADINNGGDLSKYISDDTPHPTAFFDEKLAGIEYTDPRKENHKNGWLLDKGGFRIKNKAIAQNRAALQAYLKVGLVPAEERPQVWNRTMQNLLDKKYNNPRDVEIGLVNAIELIKEPYLSQLDIPQDKLNSWLKNNNLSYRIKNMLKQSQL